MIFEEDKHKKFYSKVLRGISDNNFLRDAELR